jgi:hypothetical protein
MIALVFVIGILQEITLTCEKYIERQLLLEKAESLINNDNNNATELITEKDTIPY